MIGRIASNAFLSRGKQDFRPVDWSRRNNVGCNLTGNFSDRIRLAGLR